MLRIVLSAAVLAGAATLAVPATAAPAEGAPTAAAAATLTDVSAQARERPPARLRVTPRRREGHSPYPRPHAVGHPGPGATRECVARYVQERRPSGTVIVPRMHCWWAGG